MIFEKGKKKIEKQETLSIHVQQDRRKRPLCNFAPLHYQCPFYDLIVIKRNSFLRNHKKIFSYFNAVIILSIILLGTLIIIDANALSVKTNHHLSDRGGTTTFLLVFEIETSHSL